MFLSRQKAFQGSVMSMQLQEYSIQLGEDSLNDTNKVLMSSFIALNFEVCIVFD